MISVEDAVARIVAAFAPLEAETIAIGKAAGRVLADDAVAKLNQPPVVGFVHGRLRLARRRCGEARRDAAM